MYLSYEQYTAMGGTLTETVFLNYEFEAEALINYATFNRLKNDTIIPPEVTKLTKYIIDLVEKQANSLSLGKGENAVSGNIYITSQSNDGVSTSYNGMSSADVFDTCNAEIQSAIKKYLYGVMNEARRYLLFRGLYPGE